MFHDINRNLCQTYPGLDPIKLLNYPAEDVFELIKSTIDYNQRQENTSQDSNNGKIRKKASDNWF